MLSTATEQYTVHSNKTNAAKILCFTLALSGFLSVAVGSLDACAALRIGLCCCWIMDSDRGGEASRVNYLSTLHGKPSSEFTVYTGLVSSSVVTP